MERWIQFDIDKIHKLRDELRTAQSYTAYLLNIDINLNSPREIRKYFLEYFDKSLPSATIQALQNNLSTCDEDTFEYEVTNGLILYKKLQYTVQNYLDIILKHHKDGIVKLRNVDGVWVMPNKRPVSLAPEIVSCIVAAN